MWLVLTQSDGQKIRVNIGRADAYYAATDTPKECSKAKTVIDIGSTAYYVQETPEQIDAMINPPIAPVATSGGWATQSKNKPIGSGW